MLIQNGDESKKGGVMKSFLIPALALAFSAQVVFAETSSAPLVFSFQKQKNPEDLKKSSTAMSEQLSKKLNHKQDQLIFVGVPMPVGINKKCLMSSWLTSLSRRVFSIYGNSCETLALLANFGT